MEKIRKQESGDDLSARSLSLAGLVSVQPGAVVSRTVLNRKTGTVTLFAFDEGQELSEHTAPFDAMVVCIEGRADIVISGQSRSLHAGEMIIMPAHEPHAVKAVAPFKMMLIMIRA